MTGGGGSALPWPASPPEWRGPRRGGGVTGEGRRGLRRLPVVRAVAGRRRFTLEGGGGGQRGAGAGRWGCAGECPRVARWGRSGEGEFCSLCMYNLPSLLQLTIFTKEKKQDKFIEH